MQIESQLYPICYSDSSYYLGARFYTEIDHLKSENPLYFGVYGKFQIDNEGLKRLVEEGRGGYGLMVECPQTDFYELRPCAEMFREEFVKAYFTGLVTITPILYAKETIEHFSNEDLVEELKSTDITIPKYGILAIDSELQITVKREMPQTVDSLCKFRPADTREPYYDAEGDSIVVSIPYNTYTMYCGMSKSQKVEFTAIYFPPVLVSVIQKYFTEGGEEYVDRKWYQAISEAMSSYGVDPSKDDPYLIMSALIGGLLDEGATFIKPNKGEPQ
ncbi:MAG: hypothetical protein E7Z69_08090 [Thermoplasmata archaeon]|nr:hypothetical protein [Thermoplasmata archaeon]